MPFLSESYPSVTITAEYEIGGKYRYVNSDKVFTLLEINDCNNFIFDNDHWCTLNVFIDLIDCKTGKRVKSFRENKLYF
jgi:hypothetical protein